MKIKIPIPLLNILIITSIFLAGCQPATPAAVSNEQVVRIVEKMLEAIEAGDYQVFKQDFSDEMKSVFSEDQFTSLVDMLQNASGNYISCTDSTPELTNNQGYAVYRLTCTYEIEKIIVTVTFKENGDKVEGLFFDSTNLRNVSQ